MVMPKPFVELTWNDPIVVLLNTIYIQVKPVNINKVTLCQARLVLGWVAVFGQVHQTLVCIQAN